MRGLYWTALLLLTAAPPAAPAKTATKSDTVALSFGWKPGLRASVHSASKRTRIAGEKTERSGTWSYQLVVDPDTAGLRVRFEDPSFELDAKKSAASPLAATSFNEQVAGLLPDFLVTTGGEFKRIHDLAAYRSRLRAFMARLMPANSDSTLVQGTQALLTSEPVLSAKAAEQWNLMVGTWLGGELELGKEYGYSEKQPIPMFPGQEALMDYAFVVKRRLPCERSGSSRGCVEIEWRSSADPDDVKRLIESFFEKVAQGALPQSAAFKSLELDNVILLVTEPNGLIPHRLTVTKTLRGTMSVEGQEARVEQVDVTQTEYAYP